MNDRAHDWGDVIRQRRQRFGLQQAELAELAGCSTRFVHSVEHSKPTVRLDKLLDVLGALGLGLDVVRGAGQLGVCLERTE